MTIGHSAAVEALGWVASATFVGSYLARRADTLVRVQIAGALLWVVYGALVRSGPVIAANVLVVGAAAWKARASAASSQTKSGNSPLTEVTATTQASRSA